MNITTSLREARTFASLRHHYNFRLYFFGQLVSQSGTWIQSAAQAWLVLSLTHSAAAVGFVSFCQFGPYAVLGLFGGSLSDRFDRRKTLVGTQAAFGMLAGLLAVLAITGTISVWEIDVVAALNGIVQIMDMPARQAFVVQMVGRGELPNAVALNSSIFNATRIIGPGIAGLLIAATNPGVCFALNAISYVAVIIALVQMHPDELLTNTPQRVPVLRGMVEGLRYARRTPAIALTLSILLVIATLGVNFNVLLPVLAKQTLHQGPQIFGLITASFGAGALVGALLSATIGRATWQILLGSAAGFNLALLLLAPQHSLAGVIVFLLMAGICFTLYTSNSNAMVQLSTPGHLQGRVVGLYSYIFLGTTVIGSPLVGWLSEIGGTQLAFFVAGAGGLLAAFVGTICLMRGFAGKQSRPIVIDEIAGPERIAAE
jgi:MFS family permease